VTDDAPSRDAAARRLWLLVRGLGNRPLEARVDPTRIRSQSSSKRPSVQPGDRAILYASVWQAIFGVADVVGEPTHDPSLERWAWRYAIRPSVTVADLHEAPPVEAAGIFPQSIWRHSHIRLTPEQFDTAAALITAAARH
jgi:EVE domain-containing protein